MSSITTDQGILHYEVYGRGKPVILLHGWLGSWGLWQETMTFLGQYYRTYALDFWGFGESGRKLDTYLVNDFVALVDQFMDKLGIESAPLVGHSMGGTVSLLVSLRYPQRVQKVTVVGSPIAGSSLAFLLKMAGIPFNASAIFTFFGLFRRIMRAAGPFICRDPRFMDMMDSDLTKLTLESFFSSIASLRRTDLRPELGNVQVPVLGMYGDRDNIVNPNQWKLMPRIPRGTYLRFKNAGHFIMLDEPQPFKTQLKDFLDSPLPAPIITSSPNEVQLGPSL
ncbi:MAG TPA: alpha/beta hydrolase [Anaerolineaceae bacterium]|nr:alpha/beta hydrolase [Longilinea sp.]HNR45750.1 alpha/beta hydrolase [Anaerolineaceae bacterium]HNS37106.1 alpha/beta hydrolase [Anaerolineaceae bacterium]HNZ12801.1 alpha/beta hydrolase [Anaerolineaceae bacterium]HOD03481.1 alpha/beta hydrolase [Anaerolineaceae bacterium]